MSADMPSSTYLGMSAAYPGGMPGYVGDIPGRYTRHTRRHTKLGMSGSKAAPVSPGVFEAPVYPQTYRRCVLMYPALVYAYDGSIVYYSPSAPEVTCAIQTFAKCSVSTPN